MDKCCSGAVCERLRLRLPPSPICIGGGGVGSRIELVLSLRPLLVRLLLLLINTAIFAIRNDDAFVARREVRLHGREDIDEL